MATAIDVAQYIYDKKGWVDAWRLAKLTYYSQAWSLGWFGRPMVAEEFQAWTDGPVEPNLHAENRYHRSAPMSPALPSAEVSKLSAEDRAIIDAVLEYYGNFSKSELIALTHAEQPWLEARQGLPDWAPSRNPLSQSTMRRFYAVQEMKGVDVPKRPKIGKMSSAVETQERMLGATARWAGALELLAGR
ncbi:Panacea domain-containing protein [Corynebacterium striatum]|uniref:Panacea domain-containing protein n=2 Tax=Corynebacterium striatum TaxID=43770 RepID=UPI000664ED60|nr:type II toxin-antitoxin system antitoxin SocA domain-containing protein [Corynebacterium striatum]MDK8806797.1 DUF4065 domain-containing protein [Corynebacterium striatum]MDK8844677.1 DUF4065 domain-containing protein [Corynebacterium striatum]HAT1504288.1 SocA family protein [Corynebacterium striatum]HAT1506848.1 SocA family protein [Corynebacterium striatum]HCD1917617.1 DUF4065 domain-containing protein [Corynebacterium striatum]